MQTSKPTFWRKTKSAWPLALGSAVWIFGVSACAPARFDLLPVDQPTSLAASSDPIPALPLPSLKSSESFVQGESGNQVDILLVNDNSLSMYDEQTKLGERFGSFISSISDIDYHIGMTTTDLESPRFNMDGRLLTWAGTGSTVLSRATAGAGLIFESTVKRKETLECDGSIQNCPASSERPFEAMIRSFEQRTNANAGFFRDKAPLVLVVLSDEDQMSDAPTGSMAPSRVIERFTEIFGAEKRLMSFGIVIRPGDTRCQEQQRQQQGGQGKGFFGTAITALALLTGGETISICETDYAKSLAEMSRKMRRLVTTFELKKRPKGDRITLRFTPALDIGYKLQGRKIIFDSPPPIGTRIDVSYDED